MSPATSSGWANPMGDVILKKSFRDSVLREAEALHQVRLDAAGRDRVHPDPPLDVLVGHRLGQHHHAALRGAVRGAVRLPDQTCGGSDVDDVAAVLEQVGQGGLAHEERAGEVDVDDALPLLERLFVRVGELADAGDVADDVGRAQVGRDRVDRRASPTACRPRCTRRPSPCRPPSTMSAAVCSHASTVTSRHATVAPSAPRRRAVARPMPAPAPVTMAAFP